jgi:hypothetical protein
MASKKKIIGLLAAATFAIPAGALVTCYGLLRSERFVQAYLLPYISDAAGVSITTRNASIKLFSEISLGGLRVNCAPSDTHCSSGTPFSLTATSLRITYDIWSLFSRRLEITSFEGDGVRVSLLAQPDSSAAAPLPTEMPITQHPHSLEKTAFSIHLTNASLKNSSFRYADPAGKSSYLLDAITLEVPRADSNGDSEIRLRTDVTMQSQSLSLKQELLSGSIVLRDAAMFTPRTVTISTKAGSSRPTPLELSGSLRFSDAPYTLESIDITKALIRHTVLTTLTIPPAPFKEFEYELTGKYPLKPSIPFDMRLLVNKAIAPSTADIKGTTLSSTLTLHDDAVTIGRGVLELLAHGTTIVKSEISGTVAFSPYTAASKVSLHAREVNFDAIESLFTPPAPSPVATPAGAPSVPKQPKDAADPLVAQRTPEPSPAASTKLPLLDASVKIDKAIYQKLGISNIAVDVSVPKPGTINRATLSAAFDGAGTLSASLSGGLDSTFHVKANAQKLNILPLAALAQGEGQLLEGVVDLLDVDLTLAPAAPRSSINGRTQLQLSRFIVPSTLHGQVPFNILFLPFDALITVFGGTLNAILPKSVSSISEGIRQVLDDAGRLGIEKGTIDLDFNQGKIACNKVEIDTKNLPDFTIKGSVSATDKLDFTIFIALLKLNLPLPVAGTLNTPLPDVLYLGPELVRGLGLSIGNITGSVTSLVSGAKSVQTGKPTTIQNP